ncbi:hypothetical protein [Pseudoteredinibacter isoporae]|uniref:hypothetical protein n=1 Tax=Pseudoteredinibacter isoporae TaxID=570281 RepID=UPI00333E66CA
MESQLSYKLVSVAIQKGFEVKNKLICLAIAASLGGCSLAPVALQYCNDAETRAALRQINPVASVSHGVGVGCIALQVREGINEGAKNNAARGNRENPPANEGNGEVHGRCSKDGGGCDVPSDDEAGGGASTKPEGN